MRAAPARCRSGANRRPASGTKRRRSPQKKRTLLRQERLVGAEVEDDLVELDLGEVRIEGGVEGEVLGDVPLEVEAGRGGARGAAADRHLAGVAPLSGGEDERLQLQRAGPLEVAEAVEAPVKRDRRRDVARDVGPQIGLLPLGDEARGLKAPALDRQAAVEAQHPQRDPDLRRPAPLGARGLGLPVFVPLPGVGGLVDDLGVGEHAGDVHGEHVGALAVVARIDVDVDPLALRVAVAAGQSLDDRRVDLLAVEADVDRRLVVEHAQHGLFGRLSAVEWKGLRERRGARRQLPDPILEPAVDERRGRCLDSDQVGRSGALIRC